MFQQNDPRQFVGQGHLAERQDQVGGAASVVAEAIGWAYGKQEVLSAAILLVTQYLGKFF